MEPELRQQLRRLPAVGVLLEHPTLKHRATETDRDRMVRALQAVVAQARDAVLAGAEAPDERELVERAIERLDAETRPHLRRVVNATGVVLNTNLGRAPLAEEAIAGIASVSGGYSNLEYDLEAGARGTRYAHVEELLCRLTGAEAAVVVNNCAAAVLLVVDTFARAREVVISRGQLIEIGGSFRVPEVISASGGRLVEVGTTNKTHPDDYERAIGPDTAMFMRCHPSNYRIVGFTQEVPPEELVAIARRHGLMTVEDLGSGTLVDLAAHGMPHEPTVQEVVAAGVDLVTFSGDKLLGGPQCGIVVGRRELVQRLKRAPMLRALRQDKTALAALEHTLRLYLEPARALERIPTLRMLAMPLVELRRGAETLAQRLREVGGDELDVAVTPAMSQVGGGALPTVELPTVCAVVRHRTRSAQGLAEALRRASVPVVARLEHEAVWLDPRTLLEDDAERVAAAFREVLAS